MYTMYVLCLFAAKALRRWYDSMRTRFGKLTLTKSGQGANERTDRDRWILDTFSFLSKHIVRVSTKHGVSVRITNNFRIAYFNILSIHLVIY